MSDGASNVVTRISDATLEDDFKAVVEIVRRNRELGDQDVVLPESDRLVQAGLLVQNVAVTDDRIRAAEEMLEREPLFQEGYGKPDLVQLPENYERWGFSCTVSRKADLAIVFFFGTPVMAVTPDSWSWFYPDTSDPIFKSFMEAGEHAADALENYGEFPVSEEQRDLNQGYGIIALAEHVQETWLR